MLELSNDWPTEFDAQVRSSSAGRGVTLYLQVSQLLRRELENGTWRVGDRLPTIDELMPRFGVSRVTLRQAMACLEEQGLVSRSRGRGTFVTRDVTRDRWLILPTEWNRLVVHVDALHAKFITLDNGTRRPELREGEGKAAPTYWWTNRLNIADGEPYSVVSVHVAESLYIKAPLEFAQRPALPVLARLLKACLGNVRQVLEVGSADVEFARWLQVPVASPLVYVRRIVCDLQGHVVYLADVRYPAQRLRIETVLHFAEETR